LAIALASQRCSRCSGHDRTACKTCQGKRSRYPAEFAVSFPQSALPYISWARFQHWPAKSLRKVARGTGSFSTGLRLCMNERSSWRRASSAVDARVRRRESGGPLRRAPGACFVIVVDFGLADTVKLIYWATFVPPKREQQVAANALTSTSCQTRGYRSRK